MKIQKFRQISILFCMLVVSGCSTISHIDSQALRNLTPMYAAIQQGKLEYYQLGHGSPIVLVPGYATDISSWDRRFLAKLSRKHQLIVFNHRNVGGSSVQFKRGDSLALAKDIHQLIQRLGLKKPAILGISMGGMVAEQFAVSYPEQLNKLILINTAIAGQQAVHPKPAVEQAMLDMPSSKLGRYAVAVKLFFPASQRLPMGLALIFQRFLPKQYTEINPTLVMLQQRHLIQQWLNDDITAKKLAHLQLPALILNGQSDVVIPPINSEILARTLPNAQLKRWRAGGHAMIYQYPDELAKVIHAFILGGSDVQT